MRRSELPAELTRLAEALLRDAPRVLVVGTPLRLSGAREVVHVAAPSALSEAEHGAAYDGALWTVEGDVYAQLGLLRRRLVCAAPILLLARKRPTTTALLRGLLSREPVPRTRLEPMCDALLLRGFVAPRVHAVHASWWVVSAQVPAYRDALDPFFEQPGPIPNR